MHTPDELLDRIGPGRAEVRGIVLAVVAAVLVTLLAARVPFPAGAEGATADVRATPGPVAGGPDATGPSAATGVAVVVHVAGAVVTPGIVELPFGARVADAVAAAGGATGDALLDGVNLARPLVDGEQVVVPRAGEVEAEAAPAGGRLADGRLDLNRATGAELEELPGVGEVTAGRILAWREEHGRFDDPTQLREVRGIGEATWVGLRDLVAVP